MASLFRFSYFLFIVSFIQEIRTSVNFVVPKINATDNDKKIDNIKKLCKNRDKVCKSNEINICAVKVIENKKHFKDFENGCYLFLSNLCDHPTEEYLIISTGTCNEYLSLRRSAETTVAPKNATGQLFSNSTHGAGNISYTATEAALRQAETTYFVDEAFDGHPCPYVCTDFYSPCCLIINFDLGKYFKMLTFMNHCLADLYYCKNYLELELPPGADQPGVRGSSLCWNHCSAIKYVEFSVFAEDLSSMGHYGWLHGDYKFSHIMEPHERTPGFG